MSIIVPLIKAYEAHGFTISTGLNSFLFNNARAAPFTWLMRNGRSVTEGLGIALQEVHFFEQLCAASQPKRVFVIGNSFGWSTIALGLINPKSRIVAIDAGYDHNSLEGLELTNLISSELGLNVSATLGTSPQDVDKIIATQLDGPIDLAFIDGLHTNEQVLKDALAVWPHLSPEGIMVFHDVIMCGLTPAMKEIGEKLGQAPETMWMTPSGISVLSRSRVPEVAELLRIYAGSEEGRNILSAKAEWERERQRWRRVKKWKRSIAKRLGFHSSKPTFHTGEI
ncbi:class I SAM-dependent methyltransferase [Telmatospirillum sp. J64-1]|uniref:class I SAM-dependent methyltransferase n=1 Tax=Telmatospirillum sp. J64-1 TaxID=2502183 RepID=UPI00163DC18D|nr:class I SAM-dependent methyltransferase [Telmatospirillum sp. J64-1]